VRPTALVVAKHPRPGAVKTRLAVRWGEAVAAAVAAALLDDTLRWVGGCARVRPVLATTEEVVAPPGWSVWLQGEGDLGVRLERLGRRAAGPVLFLGGDAPGLPGALLDDAVSAVLCGQAALSLARDGGFVLLGLPSTPIGLFDGMPWSTDQTGAEMAARASARFSLHTLPTGGDVDHPDDLIRLLEETPPERIPATWSVWRSLQRAGG
jgi:hypothetical protein